MKKHIKTIAAFCAMTMIFGMFSATAFADNEETPSNDPAIVENNDDTQEKAEDPETNEPTRGTSTSIDQAYITNNDKHLPVTSGSYVLTENITVSASAQIAENNAVISIDLNGHTITYSGENIKASLYIVGKVNGSTVNAGNVQLTVSNGTITTGSGYIGGGSVDNWISSKNNGSSLNQGTNKDRGGCFLVQYSSTLTLNNVNISDFKAGDEGGAICISNGSFLVMNGGSIENCTAGKGGGAISVNAAANSPVIKNNISYNLLGSATIIGSKIKNNSAVSLGGGVRSNRASVYLSNCEITGNNVDSSGTSKDYGGGGVQILGASNGQKVTIQGNMQVTGNTCGNPKKANFYTDGRTIELSGDLASNARISFGTMPESEPDTTKKYFSVGSYAYSLDNFFCDNSAYAPVYDSSSNAIKMTSATAPSFDSMNVSIAGNIALNVKVNLGSFANNNTTISYEYSYTKNGVKKDVSKTLTFNDLTQDGNLYKFSLPVESACMTAPISMSINYGVDGKVTPANEITIEDYANQIMSGQYSEIAKALLTFGGYAQLQLNINTDMLPEVAGVDFTQDFSPAALSAQEYDAGNDAFDGAVLSLLSETNIKLYFKKSAFEGTTSAPTMTITIGSSSYEVTGTSSGSDYVYTIKGLTADSNGFPATEYDTSFTYSVGGVSGEYSIFTYLQVAKAKGSNAMKNLAEAYYNFAKKCEALAG